MNKKAELAYAYRACAYLKLDDLTYTHLSTRRNHESFYMYAFGLLFDEVYEKDIIEVNFDGQVVDGKEMNYNQTGYSLHSLIYEEKPEVYAVFHLHTPSIVAVSAEKQGLRPLSQWALHFYNNIAYHQYNSLALNKNEHKESLLNDLQDYSVLLMRHHGAIIVGKTIEEALFYSYHLEQACQTQCLMKSYDNMIEIEPSVCEKSHQDLIAFEKHLGHRDFTAIKRALDRAQKV